MLLWISLLTEMEIFRPVGKKSFMNRKQFYLSLTKQKRTKHMKILSHVYHAATQLSESDSFFHSRLKLHKGCISCIF